MPVDLPSNSVPEEESARLRDEVIKRMLATPPQPHTAKPAKSSPGRCQKERVMTVSRADLMAHPSSRIMRAAGQAASDAARQAIARKQAQRRHAGVITTAKAE
jgi:hypothetical protein